MKRPTTGDRVRVKYHDALGTIIIDDKSRMPYRVQIDNGPLIWMEQHDVEAIEPEQPVLNFIIASDVPMDAEGELRGDVYIIPDVADITQIPRRVFNYPFAGMCLRDFAERGDDGRGYCGNVSTISPDVKFFYKIVGKDIVSVFGAKFVEEPKPNFPRYDVDKMYRIVKGTGQLPNAVGKVVTLVRIEPDDYRGNYVYMVQPANSHGRLWMNKDTVLELL